MFPKDTKVLTESTFLRKALLRFASYRIRSQTAFAVLLALLLTACETDNQLRLRSDISAEIFSTETVCRQDASGERRLQVFFEEIERFGMTRTAISPFLVFSVENTQLLRAFDHYADTKIISSSSRLENVFFLGFSIPGGGYCYRRVLLEDGYSFAPIADLGFWEDPTNGVFRRRVDSAIARNSEYCASVDNEPSGYQCRFSGPTFIGLFDYPIEDFASSRILGFSVLDSQGASIGVLIHVAGEILYVGI